jgi:hypothetical protein
MTPRTTVADLAILVQKQPDTFDYVRRLELERALFALAKDFAFTEIGMVISGFNDEVLNELRGRSVNSPRTTRIVNLLICVLEKIRLISSGDPYITLEGEDVTLEGRREIIVSLGDDLLALLKDLDSVI